MYAFYFLSILILHFTVELRTTSFVGSGRATGHLIHLSVHPICPTLSISFSIHPSLSDLIYVGIYLRLCHFSRVRVWPFLSISSTPSVPHDLSSDSDAFYVIFVSLTPFVICILTPLYHLILLISLVTAFHLHYRPHALHCLCLILLNAVRLSFKSFCIHILFH